MLTLSQNNTYIAIVLQKQQFWKQGVLYQAKYSYIELYQDGLYARRSIVFYRRNLIGAKGFFTNASWFSLKYNTR